MTQITTLRTDLVSPELSYQITGVCFRVQKLIGRFARERQYADAMEEELIRAKIAYKREYPLREPNLNRPEGNRVDFLIGDKVLVDLKAKSFITKEDYRQMQRYLQSSNLELGLIVNFRSFFLKPKRVLNPSYSEHSGGNSGHSDKQSLSSATSDKQSLSSATSDKQSLSSLSSDKQSLSSYSGNSDGNSEHSDRLAGFTLMEVLVATGIFAAVLSATIAFYGSIIKNTDRDRIRRELSQVGRSAMSEIEGEFRVAYGSFDPANHRVAQAFEISQSIPIPAGSGLCPTIASGIIGNNLTLYRQQGATSLVTKTTYTIQPVGASSTQFQLIKQVSTSSDFGSSFSSPITTVALPSQSLLFGPDALCFRGYTPSSSSAIQPYVDIRLQIRSSDYLTARPGRRAIENFQTLVTSRDIHVKY